MNWCVYTLVCIYTPVCIHECIYIKHYTKPLYEAQRLKEGTDIFIIEAKLPVVESFGLVPELRKHTSGSGFRVRGLGFVAWGLWFRVQGAGCRVDAPLVQGLFGWAHLWFRV